MKNYCIVQKNIQKYRSGEPIMNLGDICRNAEKASHDGSVAKQLEQRLNYKEQGEWLP